MAKSKNLNEPGISNDLFKLKQSEDLKKRVESFSNLLDNIANIDDKVKVLWREIYDNAISDRENAAMLFTDAWTKMSGQNDHISMGTTMSKYLERMCKSNEQILRLAELIEKIENDDINVTPDDVFAQIGRQKGNGQVK